METLEITTDEAVEIIRKERPQINMGFAQLQSCKDYEANYRTLRREEGVVEIFTIPQNPIGAEFSEVSLSRDEGGKKEQVDLLSQ